MTKNYSNNCKKYYKKALLFGKKVVPLRPNSINIMSNSLTFTKL